MLTLFCWHLQAALGTESAAKRTRLSSTGSPTKESALEAKRASQSEALEHDVRQVINYADEKVHHEMLVMRLPVIEYCFLFSNLELPALVFYQASAI